MANSDWNEKDARSTSSSREESGSADSARHGSEHQGDGFETDRDRKEGGMGASRTGLDRSREEGMSGSSGSSGTSGLGGETADEDSVAGGVEDTSSPDDRTDPDGASRR